MEMMSVGGAVNAFAGAASSGQVSVDADAAEEALKEIANVRADLEELLNSGAGDESTVYLGANPVGQAMSQKSVGRYNGSGDSFMVALRLLLDQTERAEAALRQSLRYYREVDQGGAGKFT